MKNFNNINSKLKNLKALLLSYFKKFDVLAKAQKNPKKINIIKVEKKSLNKSLLL